VPPLSLFKQEIVKKKFKLLKLTPVQNQLNENNVDPVTPYSNGKLVQK
jgi:hypothetical protein